MCDLPLTGGADSEDRFEDFAISNELMSPGNEHPWLPALCKERQLLMPTASPPVENPASVCAPDSSTNSQADLEVAPLCCRKYRRMCGIAPGANSRQWKTPSVKQIIGKKRKT